MAGERVPERGDRFRLTTEEGDDRVVLRVEGRLSPTSFALLEAACEKVRARGEVAVIDLSGLRSLRGTAAEQLAGIARSGVELTGASGFVAALLRAGR